MFLTFTNLIFIVKSCEIDLENVFKKVDGEIPIFSFDKSPIKNFTLPYRPEKFNDGGYYDMFFIQNDLMKVDDTLQEFVLKSLENPLYSMSFLKLWNFTKRLDSQNCLNFALDFGCLSAWWKKFHH
jgi:hypothetical protein